MAAARMHAVFGRKVSAAGTGYIIAMSETAINAPARQHDRQIAVWLFTVAFFVVMMVLVGGLTRLTDSGLSITEWQPVAGALPPLNAEAWEVEFEKYRQIPEYQLVNKGMSLSEFKFIYWWEWGHRQLGRLVGLVFFVPFLVFLLQRKIRLGDLPALLGLFALGGLQGFLGWYMVQSGLTDRVDVSQYRLAMHLGLALIIFATCFWLAMSYWRGTLRGASPAWAGLQFWAAGLVGLVIMQSLMGALVAGIDAGMTYNDWPTMDGEFIPSGLLAQQPAYLNFFENHLTVQFDHRVMAYFLVGLTFWHVWRVRRLAGDNRLRQSALWLGAGVAGQALLGIVALVLVLPMGLAAAHQLGAVLVLGLAVAHLHFLRHSGALSIR